MSRTASVTSDGVVSLNCKMCCVTLISCLRFEFKYSLTRKGRKWTAGAVVSRLWADGDESTLYTWDFPPFVPCSLSVLGRVSNEFIEWIQKPWRRRWRLRRHWMNGKMDKFDVTVMPSFLPPNTTTNDKRKFTGHVNVWLVQWLHRHSFYMRSLVSISISRLPFNKYHYKSAGDSLSCLREQMINMEFERLTAN